MSKVNRGRGSGGAGLSRDDIARAALEMLDAEGIDALSMRRLAERLGVGTMTLYGYFRSKEELLDAAVGAAVAEYAFDMPEGGMRERLRAHAAAVNAVLARHDSLPQLRSRGPILQAPAFRMTEGAMRILLDAGFPPDEAARAFRLLFVHVFGSMLFGPDAPTPDEQRATRAALLTLPEDEFPAISAAAEGMAAATGGPDVFDYGLERIIDGFEARLRELGHSAASSHQ